MVTIYRIQVKAEVFILDETIVSNKIPNYRVIDKSNSLEQLEKQIPNNCKKIKPEVKENNFIGIWVKG